jgi:hypothetical protein
MKRIQGDTVFSWVDAPHTPFIFMYRRNRGRSKEASSNACEEYKLCHSVNQASFSVFISAFGVVLILLPLLSCLRSVKNGARVFRPSVYA